MASESKSNVNDNGRPPRWRRILLKLSGEAFAGLNSVGLDTDAINFLAQEVADVHRAGCQVAVVVGGGNIVRGSSFSKTGIDHATADQMGMLATVINAIALQGALERLEIETRVQSAIAMHMVAEPFIRRRAVRHLEKGRVVILGAGTGNPHFTTDTAAALRAVELHCDALLKATNVDGVYDSDPKSNPNAVKYSAISYQDALDQRLGVMDLTAFTMSMNHNLPVVVFNARERGNALRVIMGEPVGTIVGAIS